MVSRQSKKHRLDQEQLCQISREILEKYRTNLVENIDPVSHFPVLKSRNVITASECDEISQLASRKRRAEKLVDLLLTRGNEGYLALAESMVHEKTQMFLLRKLNQAFESERRGKEVSQTTPTNWNLHGAPFSLQPHSIMPDTNHFNN